MTDAALESLTWLADLQRDKTNGGHFVPIGSNGFYKRGGVRARFDQQPVEAQAMVSACLEAHRITGDKNWHKEARRAFDWFLGRNDLEPSYLRSDDGRLSRRLASRPPERKSRRGVFPGLSSGRAGTPPGRKYTPDRGGRILMGNHHVELFQRHEHNPILTAADWPYPVNSVFNPGATLLPDGTTLLLVPRGGSPRTFPFVCRPLGQWRRSLADRPQADDAARSGTLSGGIMGYRRSAHHLH